LLVKLRLQRFGRHKSPYYRIVAAANNNKRDGKFIEIVGLYHPVAPEGKQLRLDQEKILAWLNKGAQPSETVKDILKSAKIWQDYAITAEKRRVDRAKKNRARRKTKKKAVEKTAPATA